MATSGSWRIVGAVSGLASGTREVDVSITAGAAAVDSSFTQTINGFAAVAVPTGALAVLIIPPSGNANAITLKGITTDTGIPLSKTLPSAFALAAGSAFGILTGASTVIQFIFQ